MGRLRGLAPVLLALFAALAVLALPDSALPTDERPQIAGYRGRILEVIPRVVTDGFPIDLPTFDPDATFPPEDIEAPVPVEEPDYRVLVLEGPSADQVVGAYLGTASLATRVEDFRVGDEVVVRFTGRPDGSAYIEVADRYRLPVMHTETNLVEGPTGQEAVQWLSAQAAVHWLEVAGTARLHNWQGTAVSQSATAAPGAPTLLTQDQGTHPIWAAGLTGSGQTIGGGDSGMGTASCSFFRNCLHPTF